MNFRYRKTSLLILLIGLTGCAHKDVTPNSQMPKSEAQNLRGEITKRVQSHVSEVQECYAKIVGETPQSQGTIVVQWTIGEAGKVVEAGIKSTEVHSAKLEDCIVAKVKNWTFPVPPTGQLQVISYPFLFRAVD